MYREIKREPLGIRKLDVQEARRAMHHDSYDEVAKTAEFWGISDPEVLRFARAMYSTAWEKGVTVGAQRTRDRVAESLDNGRLVKTR